MFQRPIFIFIFCLICLGAGTVWVIENKSGAHILPKSMRIPSNSAINTFYLNSRFKVTGWWYQLKNGLSSSVVTQDKSPADTRKIIQWQDKDGTWHFEHEKVPPLESQ